jgi:hypothetical protein
VTIMPNEDGSVTIIKDGAEMDLSLAELRQALGYAKPRPEKAAEKAKK